MDRYDYAKNMYAKYGVEVVCSLPYYTKRDNDRQRGGGVFDKSVTLLRRLNELGYGRDERLHLNLVYNPGGAFLPPSPELSPVSR